MEPTCGPRSSSIDKSLLSAELGRVSIRPAGTRIAQQFLDGRDRANPPSLLHRPPVKPINKSFPQAWRLFCSSARGAMSRMVSSDAKVVFGEAGDDGSVERG